MIPLRPLNVGEILDGAFTYIRKYPGATLGLSAIVAVIIALVQTGPVAVSLHTLHRVLNFNPNTDASIDPGSILGADALGFVADIAVVLVRLIATGMFTHIVGKAVLGEGLSINGAWALIKPQFARLLGLAGVFVAAIVAWAVVVIGVGVLLVVVLPPVGVLWLVVVGMSSVVVGVYVGILVVLAAPALVLEDIGIRASLRRSVLLVRGAWWRIFGITLLVNVLASVVSGILLLPFEIGAIAATATAGLSVIAVVLLALGSIASSILTLPFEAGGVSLLYIDQRMRREGLDLTLTATVTGT